MARGQLKTRKVQGIATSQNFDPSYAVLLVIPENAESPAQATFRNIGSGTWYISFASDIDNPSLSESHFSIVLNENEVFTEEDPPTGPVSALFVGESAGGGQLSYYASWRQRGHDAT